MKDHFYDRCFFLTRARRAYNAEVCQWIGLCSIKKKLLSMANEDLIRNNGLRNSISILSVLMGQGGKIKTNITK